MRTILKLAVSATLAMAVMAVAVVVVIPQLRDFVIADDPELVLPELAERSIMVAADGRTMAVLHAEENRQIVDLHDVPLRVIQAVLAVEDTDFFVHSGIDVRALSRAFGENFTEGGVIQGGSTITQQVAKNSFLDEERTLDRKLREAVAAVQIEQQMTKAEILEYYLNQVYFGSGAYGVQAASEIYFGLDVTELDWTEAATLAGMITNPNRFDPTLHPRAAQRRRNVVLERLADLSLITEARAERAQRRPVPTDRQEVLPPPDDYFAEEAKRILLEEDLLGERAGYRYRQVFEGGLRIETTLDREAQFHAVSAVSTTLPDTGGRFTAALAAVDPSTGAVRALVGGPGFEQSEFNLATQGRRQPGSSFKTFVLATAIEQGRSPLSTVDGSGPCTFPQVDQPPYVAQNFGGDRGETDTILAQTLRSSNCAYLRLGRQVGLRNVIDTARRLGITTPLSPYPSLPIGAFEVIPVEMASAYGVFANEGARVEPYYIERIVTADGKVVYEHETTSEQVLSRSTACQVNTVLGANVLSGTGTAARQADGRQLAGKTGTAQNFEDAWFAGYTADIAGAIWMGNAEAKVAMVGVGGLRGVTGGSFPAQIWGKFVAAYHEGLPARPLCNVPLPPPFIPTPA